MLAIVGEPHDRHLRCRCDVVPSRNLRRKLEVEQQRDCGRMGVEFVGPHMEASVLLGPPQAGMTFGRLRPVCDGLGTVLQRLDQPHSNTPAL